jgi:uncharacterized protein
MSDLVLTAQDIHPLLEGLAILGTGGGGNPEWGRMILEQDLKMGRTWHIIDPQDVEDTATVVSGGIMGSVKALESIGFANVLNNWETYFPLGDVTQVMSRLLGKPIDAIVAFEAGGLNTPVILSLGARLGIPIIDGDALGRSAPETNMTSFIGHGIAIPPMPLIDQHGNVVVVQEAAKSTYPDEVGRFVVSKGGHMGANNHYPMTGAQLKQAVIPNTISRALELGRIVEKARADNQNPVAAVKAYTGATVEFYGKIMALREEEHLGFYFTTVTLQNGNQQAELIIKNESMLFRMDGEIICMFPDIALMLAPDTGRGLMSVELHEGMDLVVLALPCHARLQAAAQSEAGREAMSPARYGQPDLTYQPMRSPADG